MRFPEFTGEWEKYFIRDIAEVTKGAGISKEQRSLFGTPCILYGELYTTYKSEVINDVQSKTDIDAKNLVRSKENDVIIPSSGETAIDISTARCVPYDDVLLGGDLNIIRLYQNDGRFLSYQLNGVRKLDIARVAQGSSVIHLYGESIKSLSVSFPALKEQRKIVSLLSLIDERIATQNKIIEEYKKLKDTLVEKMFAYTNKKPVLRFAEYDYDWFKHTYADIFKIATNRNADNNTLKVLSASQQDGMIERDQIDVDIKYNKDNIKSYKIVEVGDYIVHLRSFQGGFAYANINGICSPAYTILRSRNNTLNHSFLKDFFISKKFINTLRLVTYGIRDGKSINVEEFLNLEVRIPNSAEQNRIVDAITSMESKLKFEIELLILLNKQKQYLLTKMFI